MSHGAKYLTLCLCVLVLGAATVGAQRDMGFSLYTHAFLDPARQSSIVVTTNIPYSNLIFLRDAGGFKAEYSLYIKILDHKKKVVETSVVSEIVVVEDYEATRSAKQTSKVSTNFKLSQGDYYVECAIQVKNTNRVFEKEAKVNVPKFLEGGIGMGKPRLYAAVADTSRYAPVLTQISALEHATHEEKEGFTFAEFDRQPVLTFDVYSEDESKDSVDCMLYYQVASKKGRQHLYGRRLVRIGGVRNQFAVFLDVDEWDPGPYVLSVEVVQQKPPRSTAGSLEFTLAFTRAMLTRHFDKTVAILSLIATEDELRSLKEAAPQDRPRAWTAFWVRRDPSPGTEKNEALDEHLERIRYVTENFTGAEEGWKTDRGKIYITYGRPDDIETKIDPQTQGEYQIWHYYSENKTFVFFDRFGLGEYQLTNPDER
ncbi:MAG: GWxTD domain-containing protein [Candidatus Latescibacterota bacterium]|nr:MAG: GWxTD domain-containing protein [Candidatus Latescibacterota bacterium]